MGQGHQELTQVALGGAPGTEGRRADVDLSVAASLSK